MYFLPFFSTILATAVLVASEPSAQLDTYEIATADFGTLPADTSYDGDLAGKFTPPPQAGQMNEVQVAPGTLPVGDTRVPAQSPAAGRVNAPAPAPGSGQPQQIPSPETNPNMREQQAPPSVQRQGSPSNDPYGGQRQGSPSSTDGLTSPPAGYRGDQHCRQYGGCPFECHTDCVCWEWCKNANCNLAPFGEQALTSAQASCDPSAGEKFIGSLCRPYCANWCDDMKNQILQVLPSEQAQRAFLSKPLECDKNRYNCPGGPNPEGLDCLTPNNPLDPGTSGSSQPYGAPPSQQPKQSPSFSVPPSPNSKELDKGDDEGITGFSLDTNSWHK